MTARKKNINKHLAPLLMVLWLTACGNNDNGANGVVPRNNFNPNFNNCIAVGNCGLPTTGLPTSFQNFYWYGEFSRSGPDAKPTYRRMLANEGTFCVDDDDFFGINIGSGNCNFYDEGRAILRLYTSGLNLPVGAIVYLDVYNELGAYTTTITIPFGGLQQGAIRLLDNGTKWQFREAQGSGFNGFGFFSLISKDPNLRSTLQLDVTYNDVALGNVVLRQF